MGANRALLKPYRAYFVANLSGRCVEIVSVASGRVLTLVADFCRPSGNRQETARKRTLV